MEIGAWIGNNGSATPEHMSGVARCADATGLASIWAADHIVWPLEYPGSLRHVTFVNGNREYIVRSPLTHPLLQPTD